LGTYNRPVPLAENQKAYPSFTSIPVSALPPSGDFRLQNRYPNERHEKQQPASPLVGHRAAED
jgi:hypothetical protein